jgi:hypothetical protein
MTSATLLRLLALCIALPCAALAQPAAEFDWQAPVTMPDNAVAARVALPATAWMASRSGELADVRLRNGKGDPVAFAFRRTPAAAVTPVRTASYRAYALSRTPSTARSGGSNVQVRASGPGGESAWVQIGGAGADVPASNALPAALFDLRQETGRLQELVLDGDLPANVPVRITAATSTDLAQWTPLALRGSIYRFEGPAPFENRTLQLDAPQSLQGRYLRLSWDAQPDLRVTALTATLAGQAPPSRVTGALPAPREVDGGVEWTIAFPTRIGALSLATAQANSLVPVRVLARQEAGQPWRELARSAVYRIGPAGAESTNPPLTLGTIARQLRVEPANKALALPPLAASAEFEAVELVFLATGGGPYRLLTGRSATQPADVPLSTLAAAVPKPEDLPLALLGDPTVRPAAAPSAISAWLPAVPPATLALWAVLGVGVLVLALVAWRVLAQMKPPAPVNGTAPESGTAPR